MANINTKNLLRKLFITCYNSSQDDRPLTRLNNDTSFLKNFELIIVGTSVVYSQPLSYLFCFNNHMHDKI
jgi:hypothetical protein